MRRSRANLLCLGASIVALAACASIAGLEDSVPSTSGGSSGSGPQNNQTNPDAGGTLVTPEGITISPLNMVIADRKCGAPGEADFILRNDGDKAADFDITVPAGSDFALRDDANALSANQTGSVPPKATKSIHVQSTAKLPGSFTADILVVVAGRSQQVAVTSMIKGGLLTFTPPLIDFGEVRKDTESPPVAVTLTNTGNESVTITGFGDAGAAGFTFTPGTSLSIDATKTGARDVKYKASLTEGAIQADVHPDTFTPTCGDPATLVLKGTSVSYDVTVGPNTVGFGDHFCNQSAGGAQSFTVTNYSNVDVNYDVALQTDSWFTLATPGTDKVLAAPSSAAPMTKAITLNAKPLGAILGKHSEPVSVHIKNPIDTTKTLTVEVNVFGAILEIPTTTFTGFASGEKKTFSIKNTGNADVFLVYSGTGAGFGVEADDSFLAGQSGGAEVTFNATTTGTYNGEITIKRQDYPFPEVLVHQSAPLCVTPPKLTVSATIP